MPDSHPDVVPLVPTGPTPSPPVPRRRPAVSVLLYLLGCIPTVVVMAGVVAVGWYGHHHNWKLPKFSELRGEVPEPDDWCKDHNVPASVCVECQPDLMPRPKAKGWCDAHGVAECVLCDPALAQLTATPTVSAADRDRAAAALEFAPRPTNGRECKSHLRRLQFATDEDRKKAGIDMDTVRTGAVTEGVSAVGELGYDQTRVAHLSARSPGSVWKVFKRLGQSAKAGEVLAVVDAAEVGKAKAEILSAAAAVELRRQALATLRESDVTARSRLREAEGAVREAELRLTAGCQALTNLGLPFDEAAAAGLTADQLKAKLLLLGLPPDVAAGVDRRTASANLLPVVAPMDGLIVSRDVVAGEVVDPTRVLFELVDTRNLWLTLDVKGEDAARVTVGRKARFAADVGGAAVDAVINWRSTDVDPRTRTVKVRADVPNPDGRLLANTFGTGFVVLREAAGVPLVPTAAVHWEGCCHVVFVRDRDYFSAGGPKVFHVRKVRPGGTAVVSTLKGDREMTEIAAGLLPGEVVVTAGGGALLGELLRGDLGDGCCGNHKD